MPTDTAQHACVFGLGWGDEGKGKVVDLLCPQYDFVIRFNGGANAGHTVCVGGDKFSLHLLPAGVLHEHMTAVIGPGVVVDPVQVMAELDGLAERGIDAGNCLRLSDRAHLVFAYHKAEDQLSEGAARADTRIGTTARGIGPCYADKMKRADAVRACDLVRDPELEDRVRRIVAQRSEAFRALYGDTGGLNPDSIIEDLKRARQRLAPLIADTSLLLREAMDAGQRLLFEGANGLLLDIDHGTYPFVTSSSTGPHGIAAGAGVPAGRVTRLIGAAKAYSTRVGAGPFVTELTGEIGDRIREAGHEYGTTTQRPRRCGWLDIVAMRYCIELSGCSEIALMHLDTLSGFPQIGFCVAYDLDGRRVNTIPADLRALHRCQPVLEFLPGWAEDLRDVRRYDDLPAATRRYIARIEALTGVPVTIISVGPERTQTVLRDRLDVVSNVTESSSI